MWVAARVRMDADPGQIIRSLRLALEMSQAEFARAAGWSPSTISGWERGRAKPSRLAFKTILAFAEERGVRYRPRVATTALVPLARPAVSEGAAGIAPPGAPAAFRSLLYPDRSETSHAARDAGPTRPEHALPDIAARWTRARDAESRPRLTEPPRWHAEANFRLTLGARHDRSSTLAHRLIEVAIVALGFCAAFALREPVRQLLHGAAPSREASIVAAPPAESATAAPRTAVATQSSVAETEPPVAAAASSGAATTRDTAPRREPTAARLESVMAIGGAGRATFRTANDTVTVILGEWLGGQRVVAIDSNAVTLVDRAGEHHRVQVGQHAPFD
jgi:transcriptional regulator with XRE-family HTH domain